MSENEKQNDNKFLKCLTPLLDSLGWQGDQGFLQDALPYHKEEFGIVQLLNTMANLKFNSSFFYTHIDNVTGTLLPCLFIDEQEVPYVLLKRNKDNFIFFNSTTGHFDQKELKDLWGKFYFFRLEDKSVPTLIDRQPNWSFRLLTRFRGLFFQAILLSLILSILSLVSPLFVMTLYGQITIMDAQNNLGFLSVGIVIFVVALVVFRFLRKYILNFVSARMGHIVINEIVRRLLYLPASQTEKAGLGPQLSRLKDFDSVKDFFSGMGMSALLDIPFVVVLIAAVLIIGGSVALVPAGAVVIFLILGLFYSPTIKKINALNSSLNKKKNDFVLEAITNLNDIKFAGVSSKWCEKFKEHLQMASLGSMRSAQLTQSINIVSNMVISLGALATIALGVTKVLEGELSVGGLMAVILILWKILAPLKTFFSVSTQLDRIKSSVKQIDRFMNIPFEQKLEDSMVLTKKIKGEITFKQVSVKYAVDSPPALLGIDFKLDRGETLVIIGHNGSGKSSILKLILGMYNPQVGRVLIDGMNVKQINPIKLRRQLSYITQEPEFFEETIKNNLMQSCYLSTEEELRELIKTFKLMEEIESFSDGLNTVIGSGSQEKINLSFLKRLSFIRGLLKKSNLVLIDEVSTHLEPSFQETLKSYLSNLKGNKTIILTTHDPDYLKLADKVLWLDKGRVKMYGPANKVSPLYLSSHKALRSQQ